MLYTILCIEDIVVNKVNRLSSRKDAWIHTHTHTHIKYVYLFFAIMHSFMKTYLCVYIYFDYIYIYIYIDKLMNSSVKNQTHKEL